MTFYGRLLESFYHKGRAEGWTGVFFTKDNQELNDMAQTTENV